MEVAPEQGVLTNNFVVYTCIRNQPTMMLQTAVQQQLHRPIPPEQKGQLSDLQHAIEHKSVEVYLRRNFTVQELVHICEICRLHPPNHEKEVLVRHIQRKMVQKNQHSILEIIEYVLSSANMTYHILGNTLTGLSVVLSSGVMVSMIRRLFKAGTDSDSLDDIVLPTSKHTWLVLLVSLIFVASKKIKLPSLRLNMKAHRDTLKDQKEVFRDTQDSISRHRQLRANMKKTKRTERVKRLSYAIHEVKNAPRQRNTTRVHSKKPPMRKRLRRVLSRKNR